MTLEQLGQELKNKRVERHISLLDISAETRINLKFLEAIEVGNFAVLPQTYVRAMVREYAAHVGMNPSEAMEQYDTARGEKREKGHGAGSSQAISSTQLPTASGSSALLSRQLLFGGILVAALIGAVFLIRPEVQSQQPSQNPEAAFDSVVRETEAAAAVRRDSQTAFIPKPIPVVVAPPVLDSLKLEMVTKDTVWISLLIDGKRSEQYLVAPNRKKSFTAKDQFSITMGNAGGAVFSLNGKELPPLGKRGAVIRNTVINQASLKPL